MRTRVAWKTVAVLLLLLFANLVLEQPAAALNADYWRGGWRTPLGAEPHIYEFRRHEDERGLCGLRSSHLPPRRIARR